MSILFDLVPSQGLIGDFKIAVESTDQYTVLWSLLLKFESSLLDNAMLRLEDILSLMFRVKQKKFKIEIFNCQKITREGPLKPQYRKCSLSKSHSLSFFPRIAFSLTALVSKPNKYSIKMSVMTMTMMPKAYLEIITMFQKNHSKEEDNS